MLRVGKEGDVCGLKEWYPGASQQNIANCFSHLWAKPISQQQNCVRDIVNEIEEIGQMKHGWRVQNIETLRIRYLFG